MVDQSRVPIRRAAHQLQQALLQLSRSISATTVRSRGGKCSAYRRCQTLHRHLGKPSLTLAETVAHGPPDLLI
jgi:hypothetical protein